MRQNRINAAYHFLGLLFFAIPLLGLLAPALLYVVRRFPAGPEQNHYRAVVNFLVSLIIYAVVLYGLFPVSAAYVIGVILAVMAVVVVVYNALLALRGEEANYPFALPLLKPLRTDKRPSVEEMMYRA